MLAEVGISESRARYLMSIGRNLNRLNSDDLPSSIDALEMPDGQRIAGDAEQQRVAELEAEVERLRATITEQAVALHLHEGKARWD